jgi:hypothetical protein
MIEDLRAANPRVVVFVGDLMPLAGIALGVEALNGRIDQLAERYDQPASPVRIVDMWSGVDVTADLVDGVHPDEARSREMADRWAVALADLLVDRCDT